MSNSGAYSMRKKTDASSLGSVGDGQELNHLSSEEGMRK